MPNSFRLRRALKKQKRRAHDFLMRESCKGFVFRKTLWKHVRTCSRRQGRQGSGRVQRGALAPLPLEPGIPKGYQEIFDGMKLDDVTIICKTYPLIKQFGIRLHRRLGNAPHHNPHISGRLRALERLGAAERRTVQVTQPDPVVGLPPSSFRYLEISGMANRAVVLPVSRLEMFDLEISACCRMSCRVLARVLAAFHRFMGSIYNLKHSAFFLLC